MSVIELPKVKKTINLEGQKQFFYGLQVVGLFLCFLFLVLGQILDSYFINFYILRNLYLLLFFDFLSHLIFVSLPTLSDLKKETGIFSLLLIDSIVYVGFLYYFIAYRPVFIFLLFLNIFLTGLQMGKKRAFWIALWASYLLASVFILDVNDLNAQKQISFILNSVSFFAVGWLSGHIKTQIQGLDEEVKSQERNVEVLKKFNQMIVENVGTGLMTIDRNRYITHANPAALRIFNVKSLRGKPLKNLILEVDEKVKTDMFLEGAHPIKRYEVIYKNESGYRQVLEFVVSPLKDPERGILGAVLMMQDLTELKQLEESLKQKEKLAAVGQLAAGIAHEIRNPLASMSGSIQMLRDTLPKESMENQRLFDIVLREIDRLNGLISEFLEFVRPEVKIDQIVDLNHLLEEVLDMVKVHTGLRKDVQQKRMLNAKRPILAHYDKLKQALLNIVINSYQAMEKETNPELVVQTYDAGDKVVVSIKDNGLGMSEEEKAKIFEPFHTTKPKGTGLGLAITHKILDMHEAQVIVDSEKGVGTVFSIEFPVAHDFLDKKKIGNI
ncbi:MAG: PAS domain S-box protein [Bdellovibrio sp.]|nr:MAG: PAS domain S-box protein [Bdellovibrio sp.]